MDNLYEVKASRICVTLLHKRRLDPNPMIALFGAFRDDVPQMTSTERHMISFSLLLARWAILLTWKGTASSEASCF